MTQATAKFKPLLSAAVWVASLGYFVDIYDLLLFSIVRVESLRAIGDQGRELEVGAVLNNIQMTGLVLGGILWGVLADKKGRLSVLFGSIFLYSIANFLNAFAMNFTQYAFCRFFAGLGLAGELGAGITLVAETLPTELRSLGTMMVATIGVSGAIVGGWVGQHYDWRLAYKIGGILGFLLLLLRMGVSESGVFQIAAKNQSFKRGSFFSLFTSRDRFRRFSLCILAGMPIWFTLGILVAYAPEFAKTFEVSGAVTAAKSIMYCYMGFVIGDFASGLLSHLIKSRNQAIRLFIGLNLLSVFIYIFTLKNGTSAQVYLACFLLGSTGGYWAVVVTMAAEQFGTNLRATVATAVPNFIRFALVPMSLCFLSLKAKVGLREAALWIGMSISAVALMAALQLSETFGKDLNYFEKI